jgi:hypothetical protein
LALGRRCSSIRGECRATSGSFSCGNKIPSGPTPRKRGGDEDRRWRSAWR